MSAWSHLPNAQHIDWVISSLRTHSREWGEGWNETWTASLIEDWEGAWDSAHKATWDAGWSAARDAGWNAARDAARDAGWNAALNAIVGTITALVAYDHAGKYFDMPSDQVRFWAVLSEEPAAILMLPAVIARERIAEMERV